jgi:hypothetical protein
MYACIPEIGGGFFEVVCRLGNQPLSSRDPPLDSRIDSGRHALAAPSVRVYAESQV